MKRIANVVVLGAAGAIGMSAPLWSLQFIIWYRQLAHLF